MIYSQNDEQIHILRACADSTIHRVLDIGAFNPTVMSNSRALIEAGWSAVLIEPSPMPARNLVKEYGYEQRIEILCAAVTTQGQMIQIQVTDDAVSTSNAAVLERWRVEGGYYGGMWIQSVTIPQILERFGCFDCVSIDAEGMSVDLLRDLMATEMLPRCVVCEYDDRLGEALMVSQVRGYRAVYTSNENVVLVNQ